MALTKAKVEVNNAVFSLLYRVPKEEGIERGEIAVHRACECGQISRTQEELATVAKRA